MQIDIHRPPVSIRDNYEIIIDGVLSRRAITKRCSLLGVRVHVIEVFAQNHKKRVLMICRRFSLVWPKFDIALPGHRVLQFRRVRGWKRESDYRGRVDSSDYEIFVHRGRRSSVYKDKIQVAWWEKKKVACFRDADYRIIADDDCDADIITAMCLIVMHMYPDSRSEGYTISIDLGNAGFEIRAFDPTWQPKRGK